MAKAVAVADTQNASIERMKAGPERLMDFLRDVRSEMAKVATPSRAEVQSTTGVVLFTVFAFAAFFWVVDIVINHTLNALIAKLTAH